MKKELLGRMRRACLALAATLVPAAGLAVSHVAVGDTIVDESSAEMENLRSAVESLQKENASLKDDSRRDKVWKRKKHWTIGLLTSHTLTYKDLNNLELKKDFGINMSMGRTWYLPSKPIAGMVKFGIDWDYLDLTYVKYKKDWADGLPTGDTDETETPATTPTTPTTTSTLATGDTGGAASSDDEEDDFNFGSHLLTFSWGIGPSVTVNPINYLKVGAYFHWQPTVAASIMDSKASWGFLANSWSFGMHASWKAIGIGFETRWGSGKLSSFDFDDDITPDPNDIEGIMKEKELTATDVLNKLSTEKQKVKIKSFLFTISLRF